MFSYKSNDYLYLIRDLFINVFDIRDVDDDLIDGNIITRDEYNSIIRNSNEPTETRTERNIDKLFFYLIYKQRDISKFFEIIKSSYNFITNEWDQTIKQSPCLLIDEFHEFLRYSEIPKNCDNLVHRFEYLWDVQQHLKRLQPGEYLILNGKPNHGKKWIACDAVTNSFIARIMNYRIFWLNMHNCDTLELILEKLVKLKIIIDDGYGHNNNMFCDYFPESSIKNKIYCLKKGLQKIFQQEKFRNSLLVLTGVQNQEVLRSFEFYCKILVTTRFSGIYEYLPKQLRYVISINNGFSNLEAEEYFLKFLDKNRLSDIEIKYIHKINILCQGIPLILNIVARRLTQFRFNHSIDEEIWKDWVRVLRSNEYPFSEEIDICRSFQRITNHEVIEFFEQLVIFRYNINVPINILTQYWGTGSDMYTKKLLETLKESALIEIELIDNKIYFHINYVMYNFLITKYRNTNRLSEMHKQLVNIYSVSEVLQNRKKYYLPGFVDDKYFYEHIGYHLSECQMSDLLFQLYRDFGFIERKIRSTNLLNTINDLKFVYRLLIEWDSSKHFFSELIWNFLPKVEEQILISNETCLLQLALSWPQSLIKDEALRQAELLENHLWFEDIHKSKFHEIVPLPHKVTVAHFYTQDIVLFAMSDNTMILKDFNLSQITIFKGHCSKIIDILTLDFDYFLSLDDKGIVKLWSLKHSQVLDHNKNWEIEEFDRNLNDFHRFHYKEEIKYSLQDIKSKDKKRIISMRPNRNMYVEFLTEVRDNKCDKYNYKYEAKTLDYSNILKHYDTYTSNSMRIDVKFSVSFDYFYFFISGDGEIVCENVKNKNNVEIEQQNEITLKNLILINVHQLPIIEVTDSYSKYNLIFVYHNFILNYEFTVVGEQLILRIFKLLELDNYNTINFSLLTKNKKCLILATNHGCYIYNFYQKQIIETNIKKSVVTLDAILNTANDDYLIIFCTKQFQNIVYKWYVPQANTTNKLNRNTSTTDSHLLKYCTNIVYDVNYNDELDEFTVYSITEELKVRETTCRNGSSVETIYETPEITLKINKISTCSECTVLACDDNTLYSIDVENKAVTFLKRVPFPITFIKCFDRNTMLVSVHEESDQNYLIINGNEWRNLEGNRRITYAHQLYDNYILVMISNIVYGILEISSAQIISCVIFDCTLDITHLVANSMFIYKGETCFYECDFTNKKFIQEEIRPRTFYSKYKSPNKVKCFDISENKKKLVIGYENGTINVYRIAPNSDFIQFLLKLNTNFNVAINDLKLFPFAKLLLIVLNDQIYFYNLNAAIKLEKIKQEEQKKLYGPVLQPNICLNSPKLMNTGNKIKNELCLWHNKIGQHDLNNRDNLILSCYKLMGNEPNKIFCNKTFRNFLAIDNGGNIHYLRLLDFNKCASESLIQISEMCQYA